MKSFSIENSKRKNLTEFLIEKNELVISLAIFWGVTIIMLIYSLSLNNGHLIYTLDDAYIHMAIAKNFAKHGVWGVTRKEFSSSSSSLLYSLLLSLIFLFGVNEISPLIINLVFANLLIYLIYTILKKNDVPSYAILLCLLLNIFLIPLHFLIFTGMEHVLQIYIDIIFIYYASLILSDEQLKERILFSKNNKMTFSQDKLFFIIVPLVTLIRFEGMFFIVIVSAIFFLRKKIFYSTLVLGLGFLPIIIFGLISMSYGSFFFPNSVILKGNISDITSISGILNLLDFKQLIKNPHISIILIGAFLIFFLNYLEKKEIWNLKSIMASILILVAFLHLFLIGATYENQNFSRYEGYLISIGLLVIFLSIRDYIPKTLSLDYLKLYITEIKKKTLNYKIQLITSLIVIFFIFYTFTPRSIYLIRRTPQASNNIYEQQYHMGLFLKEYYEGECVAVNDIGAINYLADIECLDLRGLASTDIAKSIVNDELDEEVVYKAAKRRDCKIAIIYEDKDYGYDIPSQWTKVGEWKIKYNVVAGDDTVSFWAVDSDEIAELIKNLQEFSDYLPHTVKESGNYTD